MFGLPEVRVGIMAAAGGVIALARDWPFQQIMQLLLTGQPVNAAEAFRLGLVTEIVPQRDVLRRAQGIALHIASAAPRAVEATLQLARSARALGSEGSVCRLNDQLIRQLLNHPDAGEGRRAFLEKRQPIWSGS